MSFKLELENRTRQIEEILKEYLPEEQGYQKSLIEAMNYSILSGGKRIRPLLLMETFRLFQGREKAVGPFMAAIEMIHTSSLIHDDLPALDNDDYRRGRKTVHVVYGESAAILAGDALLNYAYETACRAFELTENPAMIGRAFGILTQKTGIYGMLGGQSVDVAMEGRSIPSDIMDYIYANKTGALLEAPMMIGAVLAGASDEEIEKVRQAAMLIGLAFQIQDDILDVTGTAEELGKPVNSDEKNHKTTYVTIHGIEESAAKVKELSGKAMQIMNSFRFRNPFLMELIEYLMHRTY